MYREQIIQYLSMKYIHADFMENPLYGPHKLNLGLPFSVAIKNLSVYCFYASVVPLYITTYHR